jgi:hypothetical protein
VSRASFASHHDDVRGIPDLSRRINAFLQSTLHHAGNHRLLCMGLFSTFLF